ncbi:MAG TPA: nuclear transport factor 2 family protein [Puia sp.]|nr:nuclear transport factor 2 family protein [Puia sp.]
MKRILFFALFAIIISCHTKVHGRQEIETAMSRYNHFIKEVNGDSIASLFTPDGKLGTVTGRDSIRKFLSGFKNIQVAAVSTTTDSILFQEDTARQNGKYFQTAIVDAKDTVHVKGSYFATWVFFDKEGWKLKKMETKN